MIKKIILVIIVLILVGFGGFYAYDKVFAPKTPEQENQTPQSITYKNDQYGFELTLPLSWQGYGVLKTIWRGWKIGNYSAAGDYQGLQINFTNPKAKATPEQAWQNIPIMVFTPEIWKLVSGPNASVAVSAAPIGPAKIGENSKYVFATPPRWYGFTDANGWEEALEISKTFKAF